MQTCVARNAGRTLYEIVHGGPREDMRDGLRRRIAYTKGNPSTSFIFNVVEYLVKAVHAECLETIIEIVTAPRPEEISKEFVRTSHSDLVCSKPVLAKPPKMTHDVVVSILWR